MVSQAAVSMVKDRTYGKVLFQKMIEEYDFGNVTWTMQRYNNEIDDKNAAEILQAFLQWLSLAPLDSKNQWITMFQTEVEEAFHAFVLNTELYHDFCNRYLGYFFHHNPLVEEEGPEVQAAAKYTFEKLLAEYGDDLHPLLKKWKVQFDKGIYKIACVGPGDSCK